MKRFSDYVSFGFMLFAAVMTAQVMAQETGQHMQGFNLEGYTANGEKSWDVRGDTADIRGETIEISNVDANSYGEQTVNLKAQKGTIDKATGSVQLQTDVVITGKTGSQLKTDTLNWEKEKDLVSTSDPVVLSDKNMVATGTGLRAQPELKTAQMDKDVNVQVKVEPDTDPSKVVTITCDGSMEIEEKMNVAIFNKNVVAVQEDRTLKADKVEVYFDREKKKIKQLVCIGHVVILQGGNKTYAEKAVYNAEDQRITLSGQPKLILQTDEKGGLSGFANP